MAARKKAVKKTHGRKRPHAKRPHGKRPATRPKPQTTATVESIKIVWLGANGVRKTTTVDIKTAHALFWGRGAVIPAGWGGKINKFPGHTSAELDLLPPPPPPDTALCWWDEALQEWICPVEPDQGLDTMMR